MIATNEMTSEFSSPGAVARIPHPCDNCKRSKLKCDQRRPVCETCKKRDKPCEYSAADGYADGRVRRFHRRSRTGCSHCKARRVRCDEVKPVCGGCRRKGAAELCVFPPDESSPLSRSPVPPLRDKSNGPRGDAQTFTGCAPISGPEDEVNLGAESAQRFTGCAPISTAQNGTSKDGASHLFAGCAPISASQPSAQSSTLANGQNTTNYLTQHPEPLPGHQTIDLSNSSASNALSLWNPSSISTASPDTLLASLFGSQSNDVFQTASIYDMPADYLKPDQQQPQLPNGEALVDGIPHKFFGFNGYLGRPTPTGIITDGNFDGGLGNLTEFDPFSLENTGSTGSTPISLNSTTAYNANLANFVRAEYRNRPEHPAYLYQLQMIGDPDQLSPYFPSLEQRHQYRHFFQETSKSLLVTPTPPSSNPFLCHFSHLALGAPAGQCLSHDAFRFALLSLASLDIGIKMSMAMPGMSQNAMYSTSDEQRTEAHKRLTAASISGILKGDPADAELAIATVIALSIRDRLAGCQEWEPPLQIGRDIVVEAGGAAAFISARPTADRRFLVEQMAVLELIGYLTIWVSPKLLGWDNDWFLFYDGEEGTDHLQVVYGWTRQVILYAARSMILCGEARDIEAMREAQPKPGYRRLKDIIETRMSSLVKRVKAFLPEGEVVKATIMTSFYPQEVLVGVLGIQACMDLCLRTVILMEDIKSAQVQNLVKSILDMSDESISRGRYAGLLLPLSWADGVAFDPSLKQRAKATLRSLKRHYHLNQELLERIINIDWATLNDIGLGDWEAFLRKHGYYVPCF